MERARAVAFLPAGNRQVVEGIEVDRWRVLHGLVLADRGVQLARLLEIDCQTVPGPRVPGIAVERRPVVRDGARPVAGAIGEDAAGVERGTVELVGGSERSLDPLRV